MQLFHASLGSQPDGVGSHFGTLTAAMHRAESIFSSREASVLKDGWLYSIGPAWEIGRIPGAEQVRRVETPQEYLRRLADFLNDVCLYKTTLQFDKILPIVDCWDDDPIGSGGLQILQPEAGLSPSEHKELIALFQPFDGIIYPNDIDMLLKPSDINRMAQELRANTVFSEKLANRRAKLGEAAWALDRTPEIVWQYMTMKLHRWALGKGYDAFSYINTQEGDHDAAYISLKKSSIKNIQALVFDGDTFFKAASPIFNNSFITNPSRSGPEGFEFLVSDMWQKLNLEEFISPRAPLSHPGAAVPRSELKS